MDLWDDSIDEAKDEFGGGWIEDWGEVMERAKEIMSSEASRIAKEEHAIYLLSDEWKQKREIVLQRDNNLCQDCLFKLPEIKNFFEKKFKVDLTVENRRANQVHHQSYNYLHTDLEIGDCISLCGICHKIRHSNPEDKFFRNLRYNQLYLRCYYALRLHPKIVKRKLEQHKKFINSVTFKPKDAFKKIGIELKNKGDTNGKQKKEQT